MEFVIFLLLIINLFINYSVHRDWANPSVQFAFLWLLVISIQYIVYFSSFIPIFAITLDTQFLFVGGAYIFTIAGFCSYFILRNKVKITNIGKFTVSKYFLIFVNIILVLGFFQLYSEMKQVTQSDISDPLFLAKVRNAGAYEDANYGLATYCTSLSFLNLYVCIFSEKDTKQSSKLTFAILAIIISLSYAILNTGRTFILMIVLTIFGGSLVRRKIRFKHFIYVMSIFFSLSYISNLILGKGGVDSENSLMENMSSFLKDTVIYLVGGLNALDKFVHSNYIIDNGNNTFRFYLAVLYKLGLSDSLPPPLIQEYISVPFQTNVYTIYYHYIKDFGSYSIALIILFFIAFFHNFLYTISRVLNKWYLNYLVVVFMYPLIMSFFQEQYFSLFSTWLQILIYTFLFNFFIKTKRT